jgi:hypothetical protein
VLLLYITAVLGMGPLAYGFIDGIYQGVSAAARILGGWWSSCWRRSRSAAAAITQSSFSVWRSRFSA